MIVGANVFFVETPLQLLNAIEARSQLGLVNNHLLVRVGGTGLPAGKLDSLIDAAEWDGVYRVAFRNRIFAFRSRFLPRWISARVCGYCYEFQQFRNRRSLDRIARMYSETKGLFLGNYLRGAQLYMRHLANAVRHDTLYVLDDGTDVLLICGERRRPPDPRPRESWLNRLKRRLRRSLIEWNETEAASVTFFTAYEVDVGPNDSVLRNDYAHLRAIAAQTETSEEVIFLGQTLVEDRYVSDEYYLDYLRKIKDYFEGVNFVYVPHPRQSAEIVERIRNLGILVRELDVPIEYEICVNGRLPRVLASFFCSALQSCKVILGERLNINAFYISPDSVTTSRPVVQNAYEYFKANATPAFRIVSL